MLLDKKKNVYYIYKKKTIPSLIPRRREAFRRTLYQNNSEHTEWKSIRGQKKPPLNPSLRVMLTWAMTS